MTKVSCFRAAKPQGIDIKPVLLSVICPYKNYPSHELNTKCWKTAQWQHYKQCVFQRQEAHEHPKKSIKREGGPGAQLHTLTNSTNFFMQRMTITNTFAIFLRILFIASADTFRMKSGCDVTKLNVHIKPGHLPPRLACLRVLAV